MKVVRLNSDKLPVNDFGEEIREYEEIIRKHPTNTRAYNNLMIIYRKLKDYKKELKIINAAIKALAESFDKKKITYNKKVAALSKALLKPLGLADKKGNNIYEPGELSRWKKRKALVTKRLK